VWLICRADFAWKGHASLLSCKRVSLMPKGYHYEVVIWWQRRSPYLERVHGALSWQLMEVRGDNREGDASA
jgi:hypothetical protein